MRTAIARFLQFLAVERNASPYTVKSYREDLTALADYLAEARGGSPPAPGDVTVLDLRGYVAALHESGYAKTTIARHLASLRSFFRFGQREGWAKTNPAKPLRNPRKGRSLPHFLSAEDLGRLFDAPPADEPMGLRDRAILETMYSAGLRVSEVVGWTTATWISRPACSASAARAAASGWRPSDPTPPVRCAVGCTCGYWLRKRGRESFAGTARGASHKRLLTPFPQPAPGVRQQVRAAADHAKRRPDVGKVSASSPAWTAAPRPIRCGTASPRTCWTAAPTSAACRNCWATRAW